MRLAKEGLEYARLDFDNLPDQGTTVEASIDRVNWVPTVQAGNDYLVLLKGPNSNAVPGVRVTQACTMWARITGEPEVLVRKVGLIVLY